MKKIFLTVLFIAAFSLCANSQEKFKGFFGPVDKDLFIAKDGQRAPSSVWLFRPVVTLSALQFLLTNPVEVSSFSSLGTGISFQHLINDEGEPYTNYGFNALILFTNKVGDVVPATLSFAVTGSFLNYVSIGAGYSLQARKAFILTGVTYSFN